MVFARKPSDALASLVKKLDEKLASGSSPTLSAFVNILGADAESAAATATKFAEETGVTHVPIVVPVEFENGPENFGVVPEAEVTVTMYTQATVKASHAFREGELNDEGVEAILADLPKILE